MEVKNISEGLPVRTLKELCKGVCEREGEREKGELVGEGFYCLRKKENGPPRKAKKRQENIECDDLISRSPGHWPVPGMRHGRLSFPKTALSCCPPTRSSTKRPCHSSTRRRLSPSLGFSWTCHRGVEVTPRDFTPWVSQKAIRWNTHAWSPEPPCEKSMDSRPPCCGGALGGHFNLQGARHDSEQAFKVPQQPGLESSHLRPRRHGAEKSNLHGTRSESLVHRTHECNKTVLLQAAKFCSHLLLRKTSLSVEISRLARREGLEVDLEISITNLRGCLPKD